MNAFNHTPELMGKLTALDFPGEYPVTISFEEGSVVVFFDAFFRDEGDKLVVVYTEHLGYHVFYKPSIVRISGVERETV